MMENEGDDVNCRFSKRALSLVGHFLSPICALRARPVSSDGKTGGGEDLAKSPDFRGRKLS